MCWRTPTSSSAEDRLALSLDEAARRVGVSRGFLELERQRGHLRTVKRGRRRFVLVEDLHVWLNRGAEGDVR
ncbi:MAG: helix-turn-helix domain-containing protein [Deltaproteobacteria bacterium]|nr:helix-turn-helix domain-containing protein [Deltaproteobacteria bacterium]